MINLVCSKTAFIAPPAVKGKHQPLRQQRFLLAGEDEDAGLSELRSTGGFLLLLLCCDGSVRSVSKEETHRNELIKSNHDLLFLLFEENRGLQVATGRIFHHFLTFEMGK